MIRARESDPRTQGSRRRWWAAAVGAAVLVGGASAGLAEPWGVPLPEGPSKGAVTPAGDTDSFVVRAAEGSLIDVVVKTPKGSDLAVTVDLIGPGDVPLGVTPTRKGRSLRVSGVLATVTGLYEIRIGGKAGSTGDYRIRTKVRAAPQVGVADLPLGPGEQLVVPFAAAGGARVSFHAKARDLPPLFVRLEDPFGDTVVLPEGAVSARRGKLKGRKLLLPEGLPYGTWKIVLDAPVLPIVVRQVKIKVTGPRTKKIGGRLPDLEPTLDLATPGEAGVGTQIRILGSGLTWEKKRPLRVFFGGREAGERRLLADTTILADFPGGIAGTLDVGVLTGSGHALVLRNAITAVPPPQPLTIDPTRVPSAGGVPVEISGTNFREGAAVTLAGVAYPDRTHVVSDTLIRFDLPGFPGGRQVVGVLDTTGQQGLLDTQLFFVSPPRVESVFPSVVPRLDGEELTLLGSGFTDATTLTVDDLSVVSLDPVSDRRLSVVLPDLAKGFLDLDLRDEFGQGATLPGALGVFEFAAGPALPGADGLVADDVALGDYDGDGDLDLFTISRGSGPLSATSRLRILEYENGVFTDVTTVVLPAPTSDDDWRGGTVHLGDVAGDAGVQAPDGWLDVVIGTTDAEALKAGRSRLRILGNTSRAFGGRRFVDRTVALMPEATGTDDWKTEDLWVGDLDGDGGPDDILAVHDGVPSGVSPLSPYYVYYESGTRLFKMTQQVGSPRTFAWQAKRFPSLLGSRVQVPGLPHCQPGDCADDFPPFRGVSLAVADFDDDGRNDVAVTSPLAVTVDGVAFPSTSFGLNVQPLGELAVIVDHTAELRSSADSLRGDLVLAGDVAGSPLPDLVIISHQASVGMRAIRILENRGPGQVWSTRTTDLLEPPDGDERFQALAAQLTDVDGDGDLDVLLLTDLAPSGGRGLRILRNLGERGFGRELEELLPDLPGGDPLDGDPLDGAALAVGDLAGDGGLSLLLIRAQDGPGPDAREIRRSVGD